MVSSNEDTLARSGGGASTGAEGKSDDQRMASTERLGGISTRGEGTLEDGSLRLIMSNKCRVGSLSTARSDRTLEVVTRLACGTLRGGAIGPEGVEIVSIVEVDGDGPPSGVTEVQPNSRIEGTPGEGVRLSLIGESWVRCKEPTTDSTDGD
jgi:hypothetical protein